MINLLPENRSSQRLPKKKQLNVYKLQRKFRKSSLAELEENTTTKDSTSTVTGPVEYTYPVSTGEDKAMNTTTTDDSAPETGTVSPEISPIIKKKSL